ncbi:MAG: autotransporter outer membrane beta-barrel domain-containing protein [Novosphingobium sp.]|uniref:autotransporter outer membrane beta-barrel domain-containing protein n=1 Tax=Novosphingobium sp. TaxID=1874826 RepID=UPI003019EEB4
MHSSTPIARTVKHAARLLATAAPVALLAAASPALADTTVSTATTVPLLTSAAGAVTVAKDGSIKLDTGTAVTVDASKDVTVQDGGKLDMGAGDGAAGIVVQGGTTTNISNAGTIQVIETFTAPDSDKNGIPEGPIAQASGRYGIRVAPGAAVTGNVSNSGTITVDGVNSAGIAIDSALTGSVTNSGTIKVKGDNSVGIRTGAVSGNVSAGGTIGMIGSGTQALVVNGDVGGIVKINGSLSQATTYTADDGSTQTLPRSALSTGKAAVEINGNVGGGIIVTTASTSGSTTETTGSIQSYGNSPAIQVGGASNITVGGGASSTGTYSLGIDGSVTAGATYSSTNASAVVIGGKGGNVTLTKGIGVSGNITATTVDSAAVGILINAGSTVGSLYNSGTISAVISQPGIGSSSAIKDLSGTLTAIDNTGDISVTGSSEDQLAAIDVSSNTSGVTIKQYLNTTDAASQKTEKDATGYDPDKAKVYTSITGNIYTGSGNDTLDVGSGKITGKTFLGAGNDTVKLADDAKYIGDVDFGAGTASMSMAGNSRFTGTLILNDQVGTLTLADKAIYRGTVTGGSQLAVTVNGGTFGANAATTTTIKSLDVGANGTLGVYVDGATGTASKLVADTANFASGSKISARITSLTKAEGTYTVLSAGTLTGGSNVGASALNMPVLYKGAIAAVGNDVTLTIARKSASEIGLNLPQSQAYSAILANAGKDTLLQSSLLQVADTAALQTQFNQMLPDYAGGSLDLLSRGTRLAARRIDDDSSWFTISDAGAWLEPIYFKGKKTAGTTAGYSNSGGGLSLGFEKKFGFGHLGGSFTYFSGNSTTDATQKVKVSDVEVAAFWRLASGPLYAYARIGYGRPSFTSTRTFTGTVDSQSFSYGAGGKWKGTMISGAGGVSYAINVGEHFKLKPRATIEYFRLKENGYTETGNAPLALTLAGRTSQVVNGTTTLVASWSTAPGNYENRPFTVEVEGGRRSRISGEVGNTIATFNRGAASGGDTFTLTGQQMPSAWTGEVSLIQGGLDYTWKISGGYEKLEGGGTGYSARASLAIAL